MPKIKTAIYIVLSFWALPTLAGEIKCRCVANGMEYEQGQVACLKLGSTQHMARCETFLNNTTWTRISDGCPAAESAQQRGRDGIFVQPDDVARLETIKEWRQ